MAPSLQSAIDNAHLVKFANDRHFAVWHGGHTINFYTKAGDEIKPSDSISIGDFETGEVTRQEAHEAIEETYKRALDRY